MLCVAILGSDVGQNRSENVGDHKLVSDLAKNRPVGEFSDPTQNRSEILLLRPVSDD